MATVQSEEPNQHLEATQLHEYEDDTLRVPVEPRSTDTIPHENWIGKQTRPVKAFWRRQVVATVPHDACRDHFCTSFPLPLIFN